MKAQSKIAKGKELEKHIYQMIRDKGLDDKATRTPGSGSGKEKGDIHTKLLICGRQAVIECKNQKTLKLQNWLKQNEKEAMGYGEPIVVFHLPQTPLDASYAVLNVETLLDLIKKSQEPKLKEPDKQFKWDLNNLKNAISKVMKNIEE